MTLFQRLSMWSLRIILIWGAIEAGATLYDVASARAGNLLRLQSHDAAIARLTSRAEAAEAQARTALARRNELGGAAWRVPAAADEPLTRAAANALRETLVELGAQAPVVEAQAGDNGASSRLSFTVSWRENLEASPQILAGLAQRHPEFSVTRLTLERGDPVRVELVISSPVTRVSAP